MTLFICKCISSFPSSFAYLRVYVIKISRLVGKSWWSKLSAQTFESCAAAWVSQLPGPTWVSQLPGPTWVSQPLHLFPTSRVSQLTASRVAGILIRYLCQTACVGISLHSPFIFVFVSVFLYEVQYFCSYLGQQSQ